MPVRGDVQRSRAPNPMGTQRVPQPRHRGLSQSFQRFFGTWREHRVGRPVGVRELRTGRFPFESIGRGGPRIPEGDAPQATHLDLRRS